MEKARMNNFVYVDNSNIWIEGKRVKAIHKGMAVDIRDAANRSILDKDWRIDFGKLFSFAGGTDSNIKLAKLYGSRPPDNDSLWNAARCNNFEVKVFDRSVSGKEKIVDTQIVADILEDSFLGMIPPEDSMLSLFAGDRDYVPVLQKLKARKIYVEVVFWNHASIELRNEADNFINLDDFIDEITFDES